MANLLFVGGHFGQRQEDHGELLPRDLAVLIVAHALKNRLLEILEILSVVILRPPEAPSG